MTVKKRFSFLGFFGLAIVAGPFSAAALCNGVVTTSLDLDAPLHDSGSLRDAIECVNSDPSVTDITFALPITDPGYSPISQSWQVSPDDALPPITANGIRLDGTTQPGTVCSSPVYGSAHSLKIYISGALAGLAVEGLQVDGDNIEIKGLAIGGFTLNGLKWSGDNGHLECAHLGLRVDGDTPGPNIASGLLLDTVDGFIAETVISSSNQGNGLIGFNSRNLEIRRSIFGLNAAGNAARSNLGHGIHINLSNNADIGGNQLTDRNIVSGNNLDGIRIEATIDAKVSGNYVGLDKSGMIGIGNNRLSPVVTFAGINAIGGTALTGTSYVVGGTTALEGNYVSGQISTGIRADGLQAPLIRHNIVGLGVDGVTPIGNAQGAPFADGIEVGATMDAQIHDNVVSAQQDNNQLHSFGIDILGSMNTEVFRNKVGTTVTGNIGPGGNYAGGIGVRAASLGTKIGDGTILNGNLIAGNEGVGVAVNDVSEAAINGNDIHSNAGIGIDLSLGLHPVLPDGITLNDLNDPDIGPNALLNTPVIGEVLADGSYDISYDVVLDAPTGDYRIEFFKLPATSPTGQHGGEFLGADDLTTASPTLQKRAVTLERPVSGGDRLVMTASATETGLGGISIIERPTKITSEISDIKIVDEKNFDYSDAPASYGSPRHTRATYMYMGSGTPDADAGAMPTLFADGDDNTGKADEDGVTLPSSASLGDTINIDVAVSSNWKGGNLGRLQAWIDFNRDGDFLDPGEQIATDHMDDGSNNDSAAADQIINLEITVPATATVGLSYARFRWSATEGLDPLANDSYGEVEDYRFEIALPSGFTPGPVPNCEGDALTDIFDYDDDNDGIWDVVENADAITRADQPSGAWGGPTSATYTSSGDFALQPAAVLDDFVMGGQYFMRGSGQLHDYVASATTSRQTFNFSTPIPAEEILIALIDAERAQTNAFQVEVLSGAGDPADFHQIPCQITTFTQQDGSYDPATGIGSSPGDNTSLCLVGVGSDTIGEIRLSLTSPPTGGGDGLGIVFAAINPTNSDGTPPPNSCDIDADDDGIPDNIEAQATASYIAPNNAQNADGVDTAYPTGLTPVDTDSDGTPDYLDLDSDDTEYPDQIEGWDTDGDGAADTVNTGGDADGDGLLDGWDTVAGWTTANNASNNTTPASYPDQTSASGGDRDWRETAAGLCPSGTVFTICSKSGSWGDINGGNMSNARSKLTDTSLFGPTGTYAPESFALATMSSITAANLAANSCDIWFSGYDSNFSAAERAALNTWLYADPRRFMMGGCDSSNNDGVCETVSRGTTNYSNIPVVVKDTRPLYTLNPLQCTGDGRVNTAGGASGYFTGYSPDVVLAEYDDANAHPQVITDALDGTAKYLITGDIDMWTNYSGVTSGPALTSDNDYFVINTFKFAAHNMCGRDYSAYNCDAPPLVNDHGDAPGYASAAQAASSEIYIGNMAPDVDTGNYYDGTDNASNATDDDTNDGAGTDGDVADDEDGNTNFPAALSISTGIASIDIPVNNTTSATAYLQGWIDFDLNGSFDSDEMATEQVIGASGGGNVALSWNIPGDAVSGASYIRLIISDGPAIDVDGNGQGEVEDHQITLMQSVDAACSSTCTPAVIAPIACTPDAGWQNCMVYQYQCAEHDFVVPAGETQVKIKAWGAGGGGFSYSGNGIRGGAGGYSEDVVAVTPGDTLKVIVGEGGYFSRQGASHNIRGGYGGGGYGFNANGGTREVGGGGGMAGVFSGGVVTPATSLVIAGGGGGSGDGTGSNSTDESKGGNGNFTPSGGHNFMCGMNGDTPGTAGGIGGGGGGYEGGIAGIHRHSLRGSRLDAGEGGLGFISTGGGVMTASADNDPNAPNNADPHYISGIGRGGASGSGSNVKSGGDGLVIIQWGPIADDYGDAPGYVSARQTPHDDGSGNNLLYLGSVAPDADAGNYHDGTDNANNATDDDTNDGAHADGDAADDEDVALPFTLDASAATASIDVPVNNTSGADAYLQGWIDFDGNGAFDADEIAIEENISDGITSNVTLTWNVPGDAVDISSYVRLIISDTSGIDVGGNGSGEVEDHSIQVSTLPSGTCVQDFFLSLFNPTQLHDIDLVTGNLNTVGSATTNYNGIGYNLADGYLYASGGSNLYRIGFDGSVAALGSVTGFSGTYSADVDANGTYYARESANTIAEIDLSTTPPSLIASHTIAGASIGGDLAINPIDGKLYSISGALYAIDPVSWTSTSVATNAPGMGALYFDSAGTLYGWHNASGTLYQIDTATGNAFPVLYGPTTPGSDGARCMNAPPPDFPRADLEVQKTVDDITPIIGSNVTYTIVVTNTGGMIAKGVELSDLLPAGLIWVSDDGGGSYNAGTGVWSIGDVAAGSVTALNIIATVTGSTPILNRAEITAMDNPDLDSDPANSFGRDDLSDGIRDDDESEITIVPYPADQDNAFLWRPGHASTVQHNVFVTYKHILDIGNDLGGASLDFIINSSESLSWTLYTDTDGSGDYTPGDTPWNNGDPIGAGDNQIFFARAFIPASFPIDAVDTTQITASLSGGADGVQTVTDITRISDETGISAEKLMAVDTDCDGNLSDEAPGDADFEILKSADPGACVIYQISFTNAATSPVTNVSVHDMIPPYMSYKGGTAIVLQTPSGLSSPVITDPAAGAMGPVEWSFAGSMASGADGLVQFQTQID